MRSLASGAYTAEQVDAQLRAGHYAFGSRFDLLDSSLATVGELDTVLGATVEMNVDRVIKGALRLRMLPDERLRQPFQYRIKPWFRVQMPDGGFAEFPLGVYIWNVAERELLPEVWDVTLGDLGHLLESGPGPAGYQALAGTTVTGQIVEVLFRAGFSDSSGVVPAAATIGEFKSWGMVIGTPLPPPQGEPPPPTVETPAPGESDIGRPATAEELRAREDAEFRRTEEIRLREEEIARQRWERPPTAAELEEIARQRAERGEPTQWPARRLLPGGE